MTKTIVQIIIFRNTSVKILYDMYMNAKQHSMATNAQAVISSKQGAVFTAYDKYISGRNLQLIKNKLIVQSWRASDWSKDDIDSTFIINLEQKEKDVILNVVHANVPSKQAAALDQGWHDFYWKPWKIYLEENK